MNMLKLDTEYDGEEQYGKSIQNHKKGNKIGREN